MDNESIVYGCIKDGASDHDRARRSINRNAVLSLPKADAWPFLCQEMFTVPSVQNGVTQTGCHTEVVHFGASYKAIEYEWNHWIKSFESLLKKMYWSSAVVHLETELSGVHSFYWETSEDFHHPDSSDLRVRCEWVREQGVLA